MECKQWLPLLLAYVYLSAATCAVDARKPNIVLILADDMGFNDVSFHGSTQIPTPSIDKLAHEGVIFSRFYAQSRCTPSRSALMTGKYPFKIGMQEQPIKPGEPWGLPLHQKILPQYLKELGYSTHIVGKWHLGEHRSAFLPTNRGFDTFTGTTGGFLDHYDYSVFGKGYGLFNGTAALRGYNGTYLPDLTADWAVSIIERQSQAANPFFLFVSMLAPRATANLAVKGLQASPEYLNRSAVQAIKDPARRSYAAMMQAVDETVKKVHDALVKTGTLNNTILWFLSDNGGPFPLPGTYTAVPPTSNWPLRGVKGTLFDGGVRVPAFVWASPLYLSSTRRISKNLFYIGDLFPTFIAIGGGEPVKIEGLDAVNQWDALRQPELSAPRSSLLLDIYNEYDRPQFAAINGSYKVVAGLFSRGSAIGNGWIRPTGTTDEKPERHSGPAAVECDYAASARGRLCHAGQAPCLFDIKQDPCEFNNIADSEPEVLANLMNFVAVENRSYVPLIQVTVADPRSDPERNGGLWKPWLDDVDLVNTSAPVILASLKQPKPV